MTMSGRGRGSDRFGRREIAHVAPDATSALIQAMRRIEARLTEGRRRGQVLEECRAVLGATSMALCHVRQDGELAIVCLAGDRPPAATLHEVVMRIPRRSRDWFSVLHRGDSTALALAGRGSDLVYASLPHSAKAWAEDFVAFVAEQLLQSSNPGVGSPAPSSARALVLAPEMVVGPSAAMRELLEQMTATVGSGLDVVLSGETGTGKELLARVVHGSGPTCKGPFVAVNCAAIPGELLEAELFGVERGVATGVDPRAGLFMEADGGAMFLDEVAELPERLQAKLLRVLQEREVLPLGAKRPRKISVRIISACNRDLAGLVAAGRFRADLYYRLRGLEFHLPPLRNRKDDIPMLAVELLSRAAGEYGKDILGITNEALDLLREYAWPGNVRELQSEIRRAVLLCEDHHSLEAKHFLLLMKSPATVAAPLRVDETIAPARTLRERMDLVERQEIERALRASRGNRSLAARTLGITRNGLAHKLRRLGIEVSQ
ncbi:MAG: sigma-54 interaction domain-containing protein [Thermoanaerobaculia bacterium]